MSATCSCGADLVDVGPDGALCRNGHRLTRDSQGGLVGTRAGVRRHTRKDAPAEGDAFNFLDQGGDVDELRRALAAAPVLPARSSNATAAPVVPTPTLVRLDSVADEVVSWLWPGRLPQGKLSILDGDPDLGKSTLALDLAARITRGDAMPDGQRGDLAGRAGVVLLSAEDGLGDTIKPRLVAAGADTARVVALTTVRDVDGERLPTLCDLAEIELAIRDVGAALVVIDPLMAYLPPAINSHRDQDVRRALAPLAQLAERTGAAILVIRHLNKTDASNPLHRGGGSIGIIGAARSGLLVARDPDDPTEERRILAMVKHNLAQAKPALAYRLVAPNGVPVIRWEGPTTHTARQLLSVPADPDERASRQDAAEWLRDILATGPVAVTDINAAAHAAGYSARTLDRAKIDAGVRAAKVGFGKEAHWTWRLVEQASNQPKSANPIKSATGALRLDGSLLRGDERDVSPSHSSGNGQQATDQPKSANDHDASAVLTLAGPCGWRKVELSPGISVGGDEDAWRRFAGTARPDHLDLAHRRLQALAEALPLAGMGVVS